MGVIKINYDLQKKIRRANLDEAWGNELGIVLETIKETIPLLFGSLVFHKIRNFKMEEMINNSLILESLLCLILGYKNLFLNQEEKAFMVLEKLILLLKKEYINTNIDFLLETECKGFNILVTKDEMGSYKLLSQKLFLVPVSVGNVGVWVLQQHTLIPYSMEYILVLGEMEEDYSLAFSKF